MLSDMGLKTLFLLHCSLVLGSIYLSRGYEHPGERLMGSMVEEMEFLHKNHAWELVELLLMN